MDTLLVLGLHNALAATILALLVAGLSWMCRRPALIHSLWLLVLLKLVTPPLWSVTFPWPTDLKAPVAETTPSTTTSLEPPTVPFAGAGGDPTVAASSPEFVPVVRPAAGSWRLVVAVLWATGSVLWLLLAGQRIGRFRRLLRTTQPAEAAVQEQAQRLARRLGLVRCPGVYLVAAPISPLLWALSTTPRLLVPAALWHGLTATQRDTLLVHELAHLRRRDHWVRVLELVVLALYWWHPVVWWARRELHEAEEQCCDAWVLWALPEGAPAYASALLATVAYLAEARPILPAAASGMGHVKALKRRLTMILQGTTSRALGWGGLLAVLGLGALLLPLVPTVAQHEAEASAPFFDEPAVRSDAKIEILKVGGPKLANHPILLSQLALKRERTEQIEQARDEMELLEVQLQVRQAQLQGARTSLVRATERLKRLQTLQKQGTISTEELEEARDVVASQEAELRVKEAELREPELHLKQARRRLERLVGSAEPTPHPEPRPQPKAEPRPQHRTAPDPRPADESSRLQELETKLNLLRKQLEDLRQELRRQRPAQNQPDDVYRK